MAQQRPRSISGTRFRGHLVGGGGPCSCAPGPCLTQTMEMVSGLVRYVSRRALARTQNLGLGVRLRKAHMRQGPAQAGVGILHLEVRHVLPLRASCSFGLFGNWEVHMQK